ncbi:unnamed protein product [Microthlaspi erraticum]|uniref:Uncharacterized protein n=1 Tax=Microthlaspi erraticum TaxID=1685480 RepID=A0A6D2J3N8_9BRAS|nr:unnamed protein product [Microthlaspi erraticum]
MKILVSKSHVRVIEAINLVGREVINISHSGELRVWVDGMPRVWILLVERVTTASVSKVTRETLIILNSVALQINSNNEICHVRLQILSRQFFALKVTVQGKEATYCEDGKPKVTVQVYF